ncbi:polysaccharide deacetylase [Chthoniobacter flavus Ellin428]|uniref:Polysaccharide deacetylase n=1 Tax=Chthoniobacter flavus Ellin428 TaxID=497964 RepID=B4CZS3_9BACT|nr:polysaccharide deacetylase family protein [Chthoniobacter flavus]EDY20237.1 polysaccharide deacetylase [Chthoniobacter flavus Ellin428]TCO94134.1 peptidoglycan/xylan/chitin deacetylase (PgdA/CDA1 family) [Chthoniobacter flavus]
MQRLSLAAFALLATFILAVSAVAATKSHSAKATPTPAPAPAAATPAPDSSASATPVPSGTPPTGTPKITYSQCHVDGPYIAMTFDDGPHIQNTPRLLDMLKERKIHATFFMVGECVVQYPEIVKRIVAEGHEVGNHSWSHPDLAKMSEGAVHDQIQKTHDAIVNACGVAPKLLRPPYGAFTARQRAWANGTWGYKIILWDVDPEDWKIRNAEHVKTEILKHTVPGSIILSHDIHKTTIDAMPETLDTLLKKGYKFVTVSELLAMDHPATPKPKATPKPPATPAAADASTTPPATTTPAPATPVPAAKP